MNISHNTTAFPGKATVFIVNGPPRSGKDSFIAFLSKIYASFGVTSVEHSSIDIIRYMLSELGIDTSAKTAADRKLLAGIGSLVEEHSNFRTNNCIHEVIQAEQDYPTGAVVFLHIREPENIARVVEFLRVRGNPIWKVQVLSQRAEVPSNPVDAGTGEVPYDFTVNNNGTLADLNCEARALFNILQLRKPPKQFPRPWEAVISTHTEVLV